MNAALELTVERRSGMPLYLQLRHHLEHQIRTGRLLAGTRLPPERLLARELDVSRNTVSMAYRALELDGWLRSRQGQGTFVSSFPVDTRLAAGQERLQDLITLGLEEAVAFGYTPQTFLEMVRAQVEGQAHLALVRVAMIECNREQLEYLARELQMGPGVQVSPVLLADIIRVPEHAQTVLNGADLVVTTFFHLEEVQALLPEEAMVLGIALDPLLETMVQIARLPSGTRVGLVCLSRAFTERVEKSMELAGISDLQVEVTTTQSQHDLAAFLQRQSVILVSPGRKEQLARLGYAGDRIIEFVYRPDAGSINLLKAAVIKARQHKKCQQRSDQHGSEGSQELSGQHRPRMV